MAKKIKLTRNISLVEFNNGYWYADEIKAFSKELGIPNSSKLRKDELESLIKQFIQTGKVTPSKRKNINQLGVKDFELGLTLTMAINNYTSNKVTKQFIEREALKLKPELKKKSGVRYRLNRWREEQINAGKKITYGDLVNHYIELSEKDRPFERIAHGRYINFIADFQKHEPTATRRDALKSWDILKKLDIPKNYQSWKAYNKKTKRTQNVSSKHKS